MENTTNNSLPTNSVPSTDIEQQHKDIQAELNSLLSHRVEESSHPVEHVSSPAPIETVNVHHEATPAFLGMSSAQNISTKQETHAYIPPVSHVAQVDLSPEYTEPSRSFAPVPTPKSSHTILWIIILLSVLFLALLGGAAYWYLKIYSPQNMTEELAPVASTTEDATTAKTFTSPTRSKDTPFQATTKPQPVKTPEVKSYSVSDKDKVSAYIRSHINTLSPKKSSSKFTVSDIVFDGPDRSVVSYRNSKASYSAVAVSYIDSKGDVKITSFTILEK